VGLKEAVEEVARGLVDIGVGKDDVFNIYAATRCVDAGTSSPQMLIRS
jgi:hypothetical protein